MSDFDRIEEARERNEGLHYEEYHERMSAEDPAYDEESYEDVLYDIARAQQRVLRMIEENGFVFEDIGREPGNWQHLAFTLYSEICEIDVKVRNALGLGIGKEE